MKLEQFINTSFLDIRGTERTDSLHTALVELLRKQRPELVDMEVRYETRYPDGYGGMFKLDIAFFDADDNCRLVVLDKALNSSVGKNIKNYGNTTVGEAARLMYSEKPPAEVLFITVTPRLAPVFNKQGEVQRLDDVVNCVAQTNPQKILDQQYDGNVRAAYIFYDIVDVKDKKTQQQFQPIEFENLDIPRL